MMKKMQGKWKKKSFFRGGGGGFTGEFGKLCVSLEKTCLPLKIQTIQKISKFQKMPIDLKDTKGPRPSKRSKRSVQESARVFNFAYQWLRIWSINCTASTARTKIAGRYLLSVDFKILNFANYVKYFPTKRNSLQHIYNY